MSKNSTTNNQSQRRESTGNRTRQDVSNVEEPFGARNHIRGDFAGDENAEKHAQSHGKSTKVKSRMTDKSRSRTPEI